MGQITGKVDIRIDGKKIPTENQATLNVGGYKRDGEMHGEVNYFTKKNEIPMLKFTVLQTKDFDAIELSDIEGVTVLFEADTGQKYSMREAYTAEPVEFGGDGKAPMQMSGQRPEKV